MEYECGPLLLYSQDKIRMMDFLSDVFEFDVDSVSDSVHRGPLYLKLCEQSSTDEFSRNKGIVFSFKVRSEDELREIMSKYNFFLYRKTQGPYELEKVDLEKSERTTTLTLTDIDQRLWRFELDHRPEF